MVFFFKQKTAYDMRISDWSSDVCSSDLFRGQAGYRAHRGNLDRMPERLWRAMAVRGKADRGRRHVRPGGATFPELCGGAVGAIGRLLQLEQRQIGRAHV